jgi:hypothetical protein
MYLFFLIVLTLAASALAAAAQPGWVRLTDTLLIKACPGTIGVYDFSLCKGVITAVGRRRRGYRTKPDDPLGRRP